MPGLADSPRWEVLTPDPGEVARLADELGIPPIVARVMVARGIRTPEAGRRFLAPSLGRDWADPLAIPGMGEAADRIDQALSSREQIAVFGDFDVDGMSATCLLTLGLRVLGGRVEPYIPHRFGEGYGLSREALNRVIDGCHPDLIITVDNGIAARDEVAWLKDQGIDVVITDHHEPGDLVPQGVPVTDPKLDGNRVSRELAGAGVALKLVGELGRRHGMPDLWRRYTEVATLGTISDMMELDFENRALVADGIEHLRHTERPGIQALAATAGVDLSTITADQLPFSIIPRLNAAGRMGTTDVAFELLVTEDPAEAAVLAGKLESVNTERREIEATLTEDAMAQVEATYHGQRCIVVGGEGWHEGVKGIVASRVTNRYHVPTILFTISDGVARGSGRSVGSVDLFHAVEQCSDLLVRFGGHAGAVGVTLDAEKLPAFRERLEAVMEELPAEQFQDKGEVCALVPLSEMTVDTIASLEMLQPFGQGNKKPLFGTRGVMMQHRSRVGAAANHLRFFASDGVTSVPAIMFRTPDIERANDYDGAVDLVFEPVNETWQGRTKPKLMVRDILYRDEPKSDAPAAAFADGLFAHAAEVFSAETPEGPRGLMRSPEGTIGAPSTAAQRERERLSGLSSDALAAELAKRFIGEHELLPAQKEALDRLGAGRSTLCVMATGRGKSLIFHIHAAREAILRQRMSIFVYPLRALVADQSHHLVDAFAPLGLTVRVITGETPQDERERIYRDMAAHAIDVLLTTPEFLQIHAERLSSAARVGFLVIDEAHHMGGSRGGGREAYASLPEIRERLGNPVTLAVTATAATPVAREICELAGIHAEDVIVDRTVRDNLHVRDLRELRDRDTAVASVVARGDKTVIYVNSREQSVSLARMLRKAVPELAPRIAFYNAGLERPDRLKVEEAFRSGALTCIVSTSAFGEGVNLPDIRNVMLYHMPFGAIEFNQMSGRAGRDGDDATIYLLFGSRDARINERILSSACPARDDLVVLYRALKTLAAHAGGDSEGPIQMANADIASVCLDIAPTCRLDESSVSCGIAIFEELGFLHVSGFGPSREILMASNPERMELTRSIRYQEGLKTRDEFAQFRDWVLSSRPQEMLDRINRPIIPNFGKIVDG